MYLRSWPADRLTRSARGAPASAPMPVPAALRRNRHARPSLDHASCDPSPWTRRTVALLSEDRRRCVTSVRLDANQYVGHRRSAGMITDFNQLATLCNCLWQQCAPVVSKVLGGAAQRKIWCCLPRIAYWIGPGNARPRDAAPDTPAGETRPCVAFRPPGPTPLAAGRLPPRAVRPAVVCPPGARPSHAIAAALTRNAAAECRPAGRGLPSPGTDGDHPACGWT